MGGRNRDTDVDERGNVLLVDSGTGAVDERHPFDVHPERPRREELRCGRLRWPDRHVEDAEDPPQPGNRALCLVHDLGELGDGLEEAIGEEQESNQRAGAETRIRAKCHPDRDHRRNSEHRENLAGGKQECRELARPHLGGRPARGHSVCVVDDAPLHAITAHHVRSGHHLGDLTHRVPVHLT